MKHKATQTKAELALLGAYASGDLRRIISAGRRYIQAVRQRQWPEVCRYGHIQCSLRHGGPCSDEAFSEVASAYRQLDDTLSDEEVHAKASE